MIFLHGPFLLEFLSMIPVMVRRKLSCCPCWNAHRRPALVEREETVVDIDIDPVRVGLVERPCRLASDRSTGMYRGKIEGCAGQN
jgi:hypothetical protein